MNQRFNGSNRTPRLPPLVAGDLQADGLRQTRRCSRTARAHAWPHGAPSKWPFDTPNPDADGHPRALAMAGELPAADTHTTVTGAERVVGSGERVARPSPSQRIENPHRPASRVPLCPTTAPYTPRPRRPRSSHSSTGPTCAGTPGRHQLERG